jgi:DNA-nicking Smr family endonuclease
MSRRRLSDEERALWSGVMRSVAPLRKAIDRSMAAPTGPKAAPGKPSPVRAVLPNAPPAPARPPAAPSLAPLGRRLRQRLARGANAIDGRLDLHGMTQAQTHGALLGFLRAAQSRGSRIVLVITGKGIAGTAGERGVLRRQVPLWLRLPEFRSYVVGFEAAGVGHGGEGALYISLRKRRIADH